MPSAVPPSDPDLDSPSTTGGEDRWLEHLTGAHSQKPGYFGRWRRTSADLERTLRALQEITAALSATTAGADVMARSIVSVATHHFSAARSVMTVDGDIVASEHRAARTADTHPAEGVARPAGCVSGKRTATTSGGAHLPDEVSITESVAHLHMAVVAAARPQAVVARDEGAVRIADPVPTCPAGEVLDAVLALGAPLTIDESVVGSLVVALPTAAIVDQNDVTILSILASQGAVAFDAARRFDERVALHRQAHEAWKDAARMAETLEARRLELEQAHVALDMAARQHLLDRERHRIAGELHDNVVQHLVSIGLSLEWSRRASTEPHIIERLTSAQQLTRVTLARLRRAIFELGCLADSAVEVVPALQGLVQELHARARVSLEVRGTTSDLSPPMAHGLFHIAQEATFNAVHHGSASQVWIALHIGPRVVSLTVSDDGDGDPRALASMLEHCLSGPDHSPYHRGFPGIRRRAAELGGDVSVSGRRGGGVRLAFRAPRRRAATDNARV